MLNYLILITVTLSVLLVTILYILRYRYVANAFKALEISLDQEFSILQKNIDKAKALNYFLFGLKAKFLNKSLKQRVIYLKTMSFKKLDVAELSHCLNLGLVILNFAESDSSKQLVRKIIDNNFEVINMTHNDILHKLSYDFGIVNESHLKLGAAQDTDQEIISKWFNKVATVSGQSIALIIRTKPINITGVKFDYCQEKISKLTWNPYSQIAIDSLDIFDLGYTYFSRSLANTAKSLGIDDYYKLNKKMFMQYCHYLIKNEKDNFHKIMHMVLMRVIDDFSIPPSWLLELLKELKLQEYSPDKDTYSSMYSWAYILSITDCNSTFKLEDVLAHASFIIKNKFQIDNCKSVVMYRACQVFSGYIVPLLNNVQTNLNIKKLNSFFDVLAKYKTNLASDLIVFFQHLDLRHKSYSYCWQIYFKSLLIEQKKQRFLDIFVYKFGLWPMVIKKLPSKFDIKSTVNLCFIQLEKYKQSDLFAEKHRKFLSSLLGFVANPDVQPLELTYDHKKESVTLNKIIPFVLSYQKIGDRNATNSSK